MRAWWPRLCLRLPRWFQRQHQCFLQRYRRPDSDRRRQLRTDAEGNSVYTYKNIDNAFTYGVETAISQPLFNSIKLNLAHTYTYAEDKDTGNRLTRRPEHIARLGIDWQATAALGFSARVRYQSKELSDTEDNTWSPAWTTLDLKLNYHATQSADVFAGVDNVTSRQRDFEREGDFGPVSGRFIYLGTTWKY